MVEAVRGFECLWRVGSKSYKDIIAKENAWKEVAAKVSDYAVYVQRSTASPRLCEAKFIFERMSTESFLFFRAESA